SSLLAARHGRRDKKRPPKVYLRGPSRCLRPWRVIRSGRKSPESSAQNRPVQIEPGRRLSLGLEAGVPGEKPRWVAAFERPFSGRLRFAVVAGPAPFGAWPLGTLFRRGFVQTEPSEGCEAVP